VKKQMKIVRITLLVIFLSMISVLGILVILAGGYAYLLAHVGCIGTHDSLDSRGYKSEQVEFTTDEGYSIRGWFTRGSRLPEVVIIVLPGMSGDTQLALADSEVLANAGYSTLIYEHRSCSDPRLLHSGGYLEAKDLISAVEFLESRGDVHQIGVLGFSTGGTAALLAAAETPRIEAVIAEGAPATFLQDAQFKLDTTNPIDEALHSLVLTLYRLQVGISSDILEPEEVIGIISPRPVFLIYGEYEAAKGNTLYAQANHPKKLWIVPGVGHGGYQTAHPQVYASQIINFFDSHFNTMP
jgi:pimeloyl-ACP methyl ester carboxylesterase